MLGLQPTDSESEVETAVGNFPGGPAPLQNNKFKKKVKLTILLLIHKEQMSANSSRESGEQPSLDAHSAEKAPSHPLHSSLHEANFAPGSSGF